MFQAPPLEPLSKQLKSPALVPRVTGRAGPTARERRESLTSRAERPRQPRAGPSEEAAAGFQRRGSVRGLGSSQAPTLSSLARSGSLLRVPDYFRRPRPSAPLQRFASQAELGPSQSQARPSFSSVSTSSIPARVESEAEVGFLPLIL